MATATASPSDVKSSTSYRSTHSSRSSVMERAREYTRKIDDSARQAQTSERNSAEGYSEDVTSPAQSRRSQSAGRDGTRTRERAVANLQQEQQQQQQQQSRQGVSSSTPRSNMTATSRRSRNEEQQPQQQQMQEHEAVVSPELLVDALSGHEDGLLAIAEKLMEHYEAGYDVMGEAIIDAFADVQKLFQHVVEAAHMEGAAFEASRREEEIQELRQQLANSGGGGDGLTAPETATQASSPGGPMRHDEFVDQDVKDCLTQAIRDGASFREQNAHEQCFQLYEESCQNASSLLPVDSDHRARLQLSLARAESMSPDRACAILRYAMDDVLRSGMRAGRTPLPDPSKRADVVLSKPKGQPSMTAGPVGVVQSSEEALNSLVEEMKEVISAPIYDETPVRDVSKRFWTALNEAQKVQTRTEERLEHNLGKLKGDFLLARAEWEERLNKAQETAETFKAKYQKAKAGGEGDNASDDSRHASQDSSHPGSQQQQHYSFSADPRQQYKNSRGVESVASLGSSMAQHARSLVGSFACSGINERTGGVLATELAEQKHFQKFDARQQRSEWREKRHTQQQASQKPGETASKSFQEYSQSPRRVDV